MVRRGLFGSWILMAPAKPLGDYNVSSMWGTTGLRTTNAIRGSVPGAA